MILYLREAALDLWLGVAFFLQNLETNQIILYQRGESLINLYAECEAEFLILGGQPLDEEVFSYGPFVMNNKEQIDLCMRNYQAGLMGNPDLVNR